MKLLTERTKIRDVAKQWHRQYPNPRFAAIQDKLDALDVETATAADVAAIIGNNSWCGPTECNECGAVEPITVMVGEELDFDSHTAIICAACLERALSLCRA